MLRGIIWWQFICRDWFVCWIGIFQAWWKYLSIKAGVYWF